MFKIRSLRRIFTVFLSVCLLCVLSNAALLEVSAAETEGYTGDCRWKLNGTSLMVTGNGEMGDMYFSPWNNKITDVIIGKGVTHIGKYAFRNCRSLKNVRISDTVITVGEYAFDGCTSLESIVLPDSIVSLGEGFTFRCCTALKKIELGKNISDIGELPFYGCISLRDISVDKENHVFKSCDNCSGIIDTRSNTLVAVCRSTVIPDSVIGFGSMLYYKDQSLESLVIPDNISTIGNSAFYGCSNLKSVEFGSGTESIGQFAFEDCASLSDITLSASLVSVGYEAFFGCKNIENVIIPPSVKYIGYKAFGYYYGSDNIEKTDDLMICGFIGTSAQKYANEEGFKFKAMIKGGDIDGDGDITVRDAGNLQIILSEYAISENDHNTWDPDASGSTDISDVTYIQKYISI